MTRFRHLFLLIALATSCPVPGAAGEVTVASASNFSATVKAVIARFRRQTGHRAVLSTGSTGTLYAQIRHGAPFDVFLAADARRPRLLDGQGGAVPGSRFTYALGRLVLWSSDPRRVTGPEALRQGNFRRLAIANPRTAPYGLAAKQALEALGLWVPLKGRRVRGENIAQAYQFVASGNAELGFVALSQISGPNRVQNGSRWLVPERLHEPLRQQAVLLERGRDNPAARAFLEFLQGPTARAVIRSYGYGVPGSGEAGEPGPP